MTTEKWQLYSQAGVDGPEYGIRIRPGYTVVGFRKEDALAIVTWQNASIQPEGDIMEKAKALRNAALPRRTYSIPGQTGYGNPSLSKGWDFSAVDELVRVVVLELITEVERLRSDWRQEHATAETWKEDFKKMQKRLTDSELLRQAQYNQIAAKDARIKELEEANRNIDKRRDEMAAFIERLEAAFLKARQCPTCKGEGTIHPIGQPIDSICPKCLGDPESMAREALERIKAETGSGDHVAGANKLILTAEQREALEHVIEYVQETQMPISNLNEFDMQELRSLLTGSKPAWEVTEERIEAIRAAYCAYDVSDSCQASHRRKLILRGVLKTMLEEAKRDA